MKYLEGSTKLIILQKSLAHWPSKSEPTLLKKKLSYGTSLEG
jgi:hypothetical protein